MVVFYNLSVKFDFGFFGAQSVLSQGQGMLYKLCCYMRKRKGEGSLSDMLNGGNMLQKSDISVHSLTLLSLWL